MEEIELDISYEELFALAMEAHELDITLNEHVNNILREQLKARKIEDLEEDLVARV